MLLVDEYHDSLPPAQADRLHDGHGLLYSEETADLPQHPLIGSAARASKLWGAPDDEEQVPARMIPRRGSVVPTFMPEIGLLKSVSLRTHSIEAYPT
jgi:hypothetical protein